MFMTAAKPRRKEVEQGPEPLATRAEDILTDLLDEGNVGAQALMDPALHAFHIRLVLFENILKGCYHAIFPLICLCLNNRGDVECCQVFLW